VTLSWPIGVINHFHSFSIIIQFKITTALYTCVQRSLSIDKSTPSAKSFIIQLLEELEKKKSALKDNEAITNETVACAHIENYVIKLFHYADDADRSGVFNK
jgi:hypothetical protein